MVQAAFFLCADNSDLLILGWLHRWRFTQLLFVDNAEWIYFSLVFQTVNTSWSLSSMFMPN